MELLRFWKLQLKLTLSLIGMVLLLGLSRARENTFFFFLNTVLTLAAVILFGALVFLPPPAEEKSLPPLPISFADMDSQKLITLSITQEQAKILLQQHEKMASNLRFVPQSSFVNTALLAYITRNYEKAGESFRIARFISPNAVFFTE